MLAKLRRAVATLTWSLLPRKFRARFGNELADTMKAAADEARRRGRPALALYMARELLAFLRLTVTIQRTASADDVRWAVRRAVRQPVSTVTLVMTLALGIAAVTTAYGLAEAILWRPLPFAEAERLVFVWEAGREAEREPLRVTSSRYAEWRDGTQLFASAAIFGAAGFALEGPDGATSVRGLRSSANYFDTLGVQPILGRTFVAEDEIDGRHQVVVLSYEFWQQHFGGAADVVGKEIRFSGAPYTIVGVMPRMTFPGWPVNPATVTIASDARQFWVPVPRTRLAQNTRSHVWGVVARLAPGVSVEQAARQLETSAAENAPDAHAATVQPLREQFVSDARVPLLLLFAATGAVLLIACANLAAVQIASFESRRAELAMRAALGASVSRLARQLVIEAALSSVLAGIIGVALARGALLAIPAMLPATVPFMTLPQLNTTVVLFGIGTGLLAGLLLAAWPAVSLLTHGVMSRGVTLRGRSRVYHGLVVLQIATAVAMVSSAALLVQSLRAVTGRDAGFVVEDVVVSEVGLPAGAYDSPEAIVRFERRLTERLTSHPSVRGAALAYDHPLESNWSNNFTLVGAIGRVGEESTGQAELRIVSPGYFGALDVVVLEGRRFAEHEIHSSPGVAMINEGLARQIDGPVLGRMIRLSPPRFTWGPRVPEEFEIVGVVENERFRGLEEPSQPGLYVSTLQFPQRSFSLLIRTAGAGTGVATMMRSEVRGVEAQATMAPGRTLSSILDEQVAPRRITTDVIGGLSGVALALAALGVYALLALSVASRHREISVRLAIGASPGGVGRQIVGECLTTAGIGVVLGVGLALASGPVLEAMLVGVGARDPLTLVLVSAGLLASALVASLPPAWRAMRVDPVAGLRAE